MNRDETATLFSTDTWFVGLPPLMQRGLLQNATWQSLEPRQALTHGGDNSGGIVGLAKGTAILVPAIGPAAAGPIHLFRAPFWFGLMPMSKDRPRPVGAVAQTCCEVARVSQNHMVGMLGRNPEWWRHMNDLSLTHFLLATQTAADLHIGDSTRRLCAVLLRVAERRHEGEGPVEIAISQLDLATMANMSRQTVGQVLKKIAEARIVSWTYRSITVLDAEALRCLVNE